MRTSARPRSPVIDLEHVKRGRRLLAILVDRFGVAHFLDSSARGRICKRACDDAVALACTWIERRTGRAVNDDVRPMLQRELSRVLRQRIAEGAACLR